MVKINSMQARVSSLSKARERIRDMKSYSHLYERVISKENRLEAVRLAKHSPRIRKAIKESGKTDEEIAKKEKPSLYEIRQMLSYLGWIDATDTYGFYREYIKPYINFQKFKRRLSIAARRENKYGMEACRIETVS